MGVSIVLAVLLAQATPPPTIIDVRSKSRICSSFKERIAPSIDGLLLNDRTIVDGMFRIRAMGMDFRTLRFRMDMLHLENDVSSISRNLGEIDGLLAQAEPATATREELEKLEAMKKALRDVARQQLLTLNTLDGTLETTQMAQLKKDAPLNLALPEYWDQNEGREDAQHRSHALPVPHTTFVPSVGVYFPAVRQTEDVAAASILANAAGCDGVRSPAR